MTIPDEKLMAYADGELTATEAAEVERAIAEDEKMAARVALFERSRDAMAESAKASPVDVPDDLVAKVRAMGAAYEASRSAAAETPEKVVDLVNRRHTAIWPTAIAASIALAFGLAGGFYLSGGSAPGSSGLQVTALGDPAVLDALATLPSGERTDLPRGGQIAAIASFQAGDGQFCREFEYDHPTGETVVAVACHTNETWDVRFAVAAAPSAVDGYAPASSLEALDAYLIATGAGAPLTLEEETTALNELR